MCLMAAPGGFCSASAQRILGKVRLRPEGFLVDSRDLS